VEILQLPFSTAPTKPSLYRLPYNCLTSELVVFRMIYQSVCPLTEQFNGGEDAYQQREALFSTFSMKVIVCNGFFSKRAANYLKCPVRNTAP
jgi:hypothetical protein